jgi:hypothetical protein
MTPKGVNLRVDSFFFKFKEKLMAIPVIESFQETSGGAGTVNNLYMNYPTGIEVDDLLVIFAGNDENSSGEELFMGGSETGWTKIGEGGSGGASDAFVAAWWKIAESGDIDQTVQITASSNEMWGVFLRITGHDPVYPIEQVSDGEKGSAEPQLISCPNSASIDVLTLCGFSFDGGDAGTFTIGGTDWSKVVEEHAGTTSSDACGVIASRPQAAAGAIPDCEITFSNQTDSGSYLVFNIPAVNQFFPEWATTKPEPISTTSETYSDSAHDNWVNLRDSYLKDRGTSGGETGTSGNAYHWGGVSMTALIAEIPEDSIITRVRVTTVARYVGSSGTCYSGIRVLGSNYATAAVAMTTGYVAYPSDWVLNPKTGTPWTIATLADIERIQCWTYFLQNNTDSFGESYVNAHGNYLEVEFAPPIDASVLIPPFIFTLRAHCL